MNNKTKLWIWGIITVLIVLTLLSFGVSLFGEIGIWEALRIVYGSVYILFLPGFILSFVFFPEIRKLNEDKEKHGIDWIERMALSFALSIAIVPLFIFYLNLMGLKISVFNSFLSVLGIIILGIIIIIYRKIRR